MLTLRDRPLSLVVLYCVALHYVWALVTWLDPVALNATPLATIYQVFRTDTLVVIALIVAATLALLSSMCNFPLNVWCLLPQQALLLMSASGAIAAMIAGQFADGVLRPHAFITADQMHIVLAAAVHALAIMAHQPRAVSNG